MSLITVLPPDGPSAVDQQSYVITSALNLRRAWSLRDDLYAHQSLDPAAIAAVRLNREREAAFVEPRMRGVLFSEARRWEPPR